MNHFFGKSPDLQIEIFVKDLTKEQFLSLHTIDKKPIILFKEILLKRIQLIFQNFARIQKII